MVRFLMNAEWDVSWFGERHVFTVGEVERDVKEVGYFFVGLDCDFQSKLAEDVT